jgi:hypothetical protein
MEWSPQLEAFKSLVVPLKSPTTLWETNIAMENPHL